MSTLLHPVDIGDTEDEHLRLGKQIELFKTVENSIIKLGEPSGSSANSAILCLLAECHVGFCGNLLQSLVL